MSEKVFKPFRRMKIVRGVGNVCVGSAVRFFLLPQNPIFN